MQRAIAGALMSLSFFAAAAAQLPPEILVERYLLRAGRLMESKDPKGALEVMSKIVSLQKEHGLRLPGGFHFKHARVALSAGSIGEAIKAANGYLVQVGREGKFYREALELLQEAERMEQLQSWFGAEKMCVSQPKGTSCWMEVTGKPDCHVWNHNLQPDEIVTWSGKCAEGRADGEGTTRWVYDGGKKTLVATGRLMDGKVHGQWVLHWPDGKVEQGSYVDWKRRGRWVIRKANGEVKHLTFENGERSGRSSRRRN